MTRVRHAIDAPECPLCEEKLKEGHPLIAKWFRVVKKQFPDCHTSCVFRGEKEQNFHYAEGRSKLKWPYSRHNYMKDGKPYSAAIDLFQIRRDGVPSWNWKYLNEIAEFLKAEKAPLDWGYDLWKWDAPHFQLKRKEIEKK